MAPGKCWLLKAEPDTRIVKGKDVKFSVDDFESVKTSPWEGVRNYEARNLMREMQTGEKALFYHSNCKNPGIAGFAEVSKQAYPDYTAWDASHPYYDAKSNADDPKWFMVDLSFVSRANHFVPLALLRHIADSADLPPEIDYIGEVGAKAIKGMDLVTRGRLSVQRVDEKAWDAIIMLAEKGGWENTEFKPQKGKGKATGKKGSSAPVSEKPKTRAKANPTARRASKVTTKEDSEIEDPGDSDDEYQTESEAEVPKSRGRKKRKSKDDSDGEYKSPQRSKKAKR